MGTADRRGKKASNIGKVVETRVYGTFRISDVTVQTVHLFLNLSMRRLEKKKFQSSTLSELMKRLTVFNVYHGKQLLIHKHPERLKKIKTSLSFTLTLCVHQASFADMRSFLICPLCSLIKLL